jgi:hypothetical protein
MNRILLAFFVFLVFTQAQAQKITEEKLLGRWNLKAMRLGEIYADFNKDSLSYDKNWIKSGGQGEEETRRLIVAGLQDAVKKTEGNIVFSRGLIYSLTMLPDIINHVEKYNITSDGKKYYIIPEKGNEKIGIRIESGILYWELPAEGQTMEMIFEKIK